MTRSTPLRRTKRKPRPSPSDEQLARKYREPCFFAEHHKDPFHGVRCDGPMDLAHLIPATRLRARGVPEEAIWDERVTIVLCRRHHHLLDNHFIRLTRDQLPDGLEAFAREHDLLGSLDRDYGLKEAA